MKNTLPFLFSLYRANAVMNRRLAGHGLDFNDFMILYSLNSAQDKKLRRIDLAHKLGFTASGVTRLLLPLEKLGIIKRAEGEEDNRARFASLTKAGEELLRDATASLEMKLEDAILEKDRNHLPDFTELLNNITENLLQPEYQAEAKIKWGDTDAWKQSKERTKNMSKEEMKKIQEEGVELLKKIATLMPQGANDKQVQSLIAEHYNNLRHFYEPNLEMYRGLGEMYVADPRFTSYFENIAPGLAVFMKEAMTIFCDNQ